MELPYQEEYLGNALDVKQCFGSSLQLSAVTQDKTTYSNYVTSWLVNSETLEIKQ